MTMDWKYIKAFSFSLIILLIASTSFGQRRTLGRGVTTPGLEFTGKNFLVATQYDCLKIAFDSLAARDTASLYIPAGEWVIYDSITIRFQREGRAFWRIYGDPGATIIRAASASIFDSTKNMLNIIAKGLTTSTDSTIGRLDISGIIFDHNNGGGTRYYWANTAGDSCGHALRTYRSDHWDRYPPGGASNDVNSQILWPDNLGTMLHIIGRILTLNITDCEFMNSNYCAIRLRPFYYGSNWVAAPEGGQITNCVFRTIRGAAISNLWNGVRSISNNYFRWVGCAYYAHTGGWAFSNNRIEEYDSCGVYLNYASWYKIDGNIITEGAGPQIIMDGSCSGVISGNSFANTIADNAYLGSACSDDTLFSVIKIISTYGNVNAFSKGNVISNNYFLTSDGNYDRYTRYFVEASTQALVDSCRLNILNNNTIRYGRGTDLKKGLTNLDITKNIVYNPLMPVTNQFDNADSLFLARIDTLRTGRWLQQTLNDGNTYYSIKDTMMWGAGTFTGTETADTVLIGVATTNSVYLLTPYGTSPDVDDVLYAESKTDTLIVNRPASGKSGLTYRWFMIKR